MNNYIPQNNYAQLMPPNPYQYMYQPQAMPTPGTTVSKASGNIVWVQGIEAAKAYEVPAGSSVILMDSEEETFYIKSCDETRKPTLRVYSYKEVTPPGKTVMAISNPDYVSRQEFEKLREELKTSIDSFIKNKNGEVLKNEQSTISNADIPYGIREIRE